MLPPSRRQPGLAPLELALGVAVAGVLLALGLSAVARLQGLGAEARRVTLAAHQAAASSTQLLRCELAPSTAMPQGECPPACPTVSASMPARPASAALPSRFCP